MVMVIYEEYLGQVLDNKDDALHPTPRNALFVRSSETFFTPSNANAHQSRPERPKGAKDEVKLAQRATK